MRLEKRNGLALVIIGLGILVLFNGFGAISFGLSKLMGYLIPVLVMLLGYVGMKNGKTFIGGAMFVIGLIILLGKLSWLISIIFALAIIAFGFSMLKSKPNYH